MLLERNSCYTINEQSGNYPSDYFGNFYRRRRPHGHGHHKYYKFKNPCGCACERRHRHHKKH